MLPAVVVDANMHVLVFGFVSFVHVLVLHKRTGFHTSLKLFLGAAHPASPPPSWRGSPRPRQPSRGRPRHFPRVVFDGSAARAHAKRGFYNNKRNDREALPRDEAQSRRDEDTFIHVIQVEPALEKPERRL